jgi:predicted ATPase
LHGLELPGEDSEQPVEAYDAVQLFLQRARQARPDFSLSPENTPAVIQVCRLVDGNPLGILIAAAWLEHFSPAEILEQIDISLDFLASNWQDVEPRHASMRAVLDSSYNRLGEAIRLSFGWLSFGVV